MIDRAVCFVLDQRIEKYELLRKSFDDVGIVTQPFFSALDHKNLVEGFSYDHVGNGELPPRLPNSTNYHAWYTKSGYDFWKAQTKVLKQAIKDDISNILLIEDDCILNTGEIKKYLEVLTMGLDWDIIYIGGYFRKDITRLEPTVIASCFGPNGNFNLIDSYITTGFHCVLLNRRTMEELLHIGSIGPMDDISVRFFQQNPSWKCYTVWPTMARQSDEYSFVEGRTIMHPPTE